MAVQLGLSAATHECLGVRQGGDRRASQRAGRDRRRGDRRRATLGSLVFSALTIAFPAQLNPASLCVQLAPVALTVVPSARVAVTIDSFVAVPLRRAYDALIKEAARRYRLEGARIRSVMQAESAFNPVAVSDAGAQGLMQLMPELALELGVTDPFDPRENIMAGARHLRRLLDLHQGDITLAVASYNAGEGAVARYGDVPPFPETRNYVLRVTHLLARAR